EHRSATWITSHQVVARAGPCAVCAARTVSGASRAVISRHPAAPEFYALAATWARSTNGVGVLCPPVHVWLPGRPQPARVDESRVHPGERAEHRRAAHRPEVEGQDLLERSHVGGRWQRDRRLLAAAEGRGLAPVALSTGRGHH